VVWDFWNIGALQHEAILESVSDLYRCQIHRCLRGREG